MKRTPGDRDVSVSCPHVSSSNGESVVPRATVTAASARSDEGLRVDVPAHPPVLTPSAARALLELLRSLHQGYERAG
jgi:hypothetical protein